MNIYYCKLTLHDNIFFASREMGLLYETEKYLHNWALTYAFFKGKYIPDVYRMEGSNAQKPAYLQSENEQNLLLLNKKNIYVFPAKPLTWSYQINTFKASQVTYYGKSKQFGDKGANRNYPINYGRAKELAVGSEYNTFIITPNEVKKEDIPKWIRVGKWFSKVKIETTLIPEKAITENSGNYISNHPLNPIDLPPNQQLLLYNRVVMPPVSLISQAQLNGNYYLIEKKNWLNLPDNLTDFPSKICLPIGVNYGAGYIAEVA